MKAIKYVVMIATGASNEYLPRAGWDHRYDTHEAAAELCRQANEQDGWVAKVVQIELDREETPEERRARQELEFRRFGRSLPESA